MAPEEMLLLAMLMLPLVATTVAAGLVKVIDRVAEGRWVQLPDWFIFDPGAVLIFMVAPVIAAVGVLAEQIGVLPS